MRRIILSPVACLVVQYFPTLFHKGARFSGKSFEHKVYVLIFSTTSIRNISHPKTELNMIKIVHRSSCKVPVIRVRFSLNLNFLDAFSKNIEMPNFVKIRLVGAMWTDGRTG